MEAWRRLRADAGATDWLGPRCCRAVPREATCLLRSGAASSWVGCVAGASIEVTRVYRVEEAREFLANRGEDDARLAQEVDGKFVSGFIRASKPMAGARPASTRAACCSPGTCGAE